MSRRKDPLHPIVDNPGTYEIVGFNFQKGGADQEPFVDVTLQRNDDVRNLRFLSPGDIRIEGGFPDMSGGLCILDISGRGVEGLAVMVEDFDDGRGSVRFFARHVIDLDAELGEEPAFDEAPPRVESLLYGGDEPQSGDAREAQSLLYGDDSEVSDGLGVESLLYAEQTDGALSSTEAGAEGARQGKAEADSD